MKVLLDTNLWRYIAEANVFDDLTKVALDAGVELVVVPAVVNEVRNFQDDSLRKRILRILASSCLMRFMPEAYLEAREIRSVFVKYRPEWLLELPDLTEFNELRDSWQGGAEGFWTGVAGDIFPNETDESLRGEQEHKLAKEQSKEIRDRINAQKIVLPKDFDLKQAYSPFSDRGQECFVEYWRVPSLYHLQAELGVYASPYREWLDCFVDVRKVLNEPESLVDLWISDVTPNDLSRQWLRGGFEFLQGFHKITAGTPGDSQLSSHLIDVDVVFSADKNFIRFVDQCKKDAPFFVAEGRLVLGGEVAVDDLFSQISSLTENA